MDQSKEPLLDSIGQGARRRRSQISRRPKPEGQSPISTPLSDDVGKVSSDENLGDSSHGGKMFNLNQRSLQVIDGAGPENKLKRIKLKVGGVTQTIQTKSSSTAGSGNGPLLKASLPSENAHQQQKLDKNSSLLGIPREDFSKGSLGLGREDMGRASTRNAQEKQHGDKSDAVRKSKRVPKRRFLDEDFDEDDEDDEIRYLEKLKTSKITEHKELDAKSLKANSERAGNVSRDGKRVRSGDMDFEEDEELSVDGEPDGAVMKKQKKGLFSELPMESKREVSLTARQRALLSKDSSSAAPATTQVEFPNGLPPAPSRKQKEKLSEVEQQLKKAEAAEKRKLQNEKAARESEAEAIRKILGQDSSRKKREDKTKKRQEELAKEKAVTAEMLSSNIIRTVIGPTGTTVTFPNEMGFPKIFEPKSPSYPPPREKCAGPSCTNPYKYRDSKLKLPLCSLQCYKAINEKTQTDGSC